jgi:hypothetical protein
MGTAGGPAAAAPTIREQVPEIAVAARRLRRQAR